MEYEKINAGNLLDDDNFDELFSEIDPIKHD